ncbi:Predicted PurR-regulated permease PerM [Desulfacinum hydrothermale DSM 13146]|uniref:Predicted PurR-regulated permease PerM n=1 Tax=Desulfacinum hydrothermale DSM 13146 TaxID=1121390 RepID=A0A1W1XBJ4_9BACT|nr:AI-2E family transporter [Desulfacinum hydrothermale]SMC21316.1 Predicted PurR-regulated permease PerM [Desulfacinum hydrothermale DSM 13146]
MERNDSAEQEIMKDDHEHKAPGHMRGGYRPFLLVLLFFSLYLVYCVLQPFLHTIIFSILLASFFSPLQERVVRWLRGRKSLAALVVLSVIVFAIALPTIFFLSQLVSQGVESVGRVTEWIRQGNLQKVATHPTVVTALSWIKERLYFIDFSHLDIETHLLAVSKNLGQFLINRGASLVGDAATLVSRFFILIFITFYLLRDGSEMVTKIKYLSPLREEQEDRILEKIKGVTRSSIMGSFLTALSQGLVGGVGLMLVGIPGLFWGSVMAFTSFIPVVGTALVWVPAVGYLLLLGKIKSAIFLAAWCAVLVGSIDNFLRPFFMRGQAEMSTFYIFLAILGGVQFFGLAGIIYGPLILGFAMVMLYIYQIEYRELLEESTETVDAKAQAEVRSAPR